MVPRRILVTGANGFVGTHLLPQLAAAFPDAVLATGRFDVGDPVATGAAVLAARPDACVHLAAISAIPAARQAPDAAWRVNLHGTIHLGRALLRHAADCRLLFAGSADAYGTSFRQAGPDGRLAETAPLAPTNTYGATKAAAEAALGALAAEGLRVTRLRPFNHTGAGQSADFVVAAFARQIARVAAGLQEPVLRVGALSPRRDFLDVRDVCAAYVACLRTDDLPDGAILNVASGTPRRIGQVLEDMLASSGVAAAVETDSVRLRAGDIPLACGDAGQARTLLGWAPAVPWERTLRDVLADWRARVAADAAA